jgi:uncharacterized membrane protein YraQ (UPF0718 family)
MKSIKNRRKSMDSTTLVLIGIAAGLLIVAFLRDVDLPMEGLRSAGQTLWRSLPILLLGFIIAGLVQVLIPKELVTEWLGNEAGLRGIIIGSLVGGLVPGSPYAVFPIVGGFYKSGAGIGAVVSFITAWSLWSITRLPVEMALIDPQVALIRYGITFFMPFLAGIIALGVGKLI